MSEFGELVWVEDDDLFGDPTTIHTKWRELFGEEFDVRRATATSNRSDHRVYTMPNGMRVVEATNGWHIYEPEEDHD